MLCPDIEFLCSLKLSAESLWILLVINFLFFTFRKKYIQKNAVFCACDFFTLKYYIRCLQILRTFRNIQSFPLSFITCRGPGNVLNVRTTVVNGIRDMKENLQLPIHKTKYSVLEFIRATLSKTLLCFLKIQAFGHTEVGGPCLLSGHAQFSILALQ